jgi:uncharacterized membrane-anchored protein YjiN (DUF445 family)
MPGNVEVPWLADKPHAQAELKRARVRRMKLLALGLLFAMLCLLALSTAHRATHPWLGWVYAFAEAAAVGAIADWFAVTALFRHPLGLPIPHTAIIPKNKDDIGASLGDFVEHNFLTPDNVIRKLEQRNLARAGADWLADPDNSEEVAQRVGSLILDLLEKLEDEDVQRFLDRAITSQLERLDLARLAGEALDLLTAEDRHQALLDHGLKALDVWLNGNRALIKAKFGEASRYTPDVIDSYVANRFVDGMLTLLHEVAENPQHDIRAHFNQTTREFIDELKTSPAYREQGQAVALRLVAHLRHEQYYHQLWIELRSRIRQDMSGEHSVIREHVAATLLSAACTLQRDAALQHKLNGWLLPILEGLMLRHRHQVSRLIADVVKSWDAREVAEKIEMEIGRDLQYIRLNGTFVGGLVGLLLYGATYMAT